MPHSHSTTYGRQPARVTAGQRASHSHGTGATHASHGKLIGGNAAHSKTATEQS